MSELMGEGQLERLAQRPLYIVEYQEMHRRVSRKEPIARLANIIADYRGLKRGRVEEHVARWVSQFPSGVQEALLDELTYVLRKTYFSRERAETFFAHVLTNPSIGGDKPSEFWRRVTYLNIQKQGTSQKELLDLFSQVLERTYGYTVHETKPAGDTFIYIDDGIFSGVRFRKDLSDWLGTVDLPKKVRIIVVSLAIHRKGYFDAKTRLDALAAEKGISLTFTRKWELILESDIKSRNIDLLWPRKIPLDDPFVKTYHQTHLQRSVKVRLDTSLGRNELYSSHIRRELLEQEFLKQGAKLAISFPKDKHNGVRPLGFSPDEASFGFGTMVVTYRNCPNNAPLVFWSANDWFPLFPRVSNKESSERL